MEDFFDKFRKKYEERGEPSFREEDWGEMTKLLNKKSKRTFGLPLYWWVAIPFISLLTWNIWMWRSLENKFSNSVEQELVVDTIVIEKLVYVTDTIIKERIQYLSSPVRIIEKYVYPEGSISMNALDTSFSNKFSQWKRIIYSENKFYNKRSTGLLMNQYTDNEDNEMMSNVSPLINRSFEQVQSGKEGKIDFSLRQTPYLNTDVLSRRSFWERNNYFQPTGLEVEIGGGIINAFDTDLTLLFGEGIAVGAKLNFEPGYRLWADVSLQNMSFKSSVMGDEIGIPVVIPPSDEYDFENAQVPRRNIQYVVGLDYVFMKDSRLRPTIGVGWASVRYFSSEIIYDFINRNNGLEFIFEQNSPDVSLQTDYFVFKMGGEYSLSRRYNIGLVGLYRKGVDDGFGINDLLEGRITLSAKLF